MENFIYLLNFTVSGIKSIRKDIRLDFYKKTVNRTFDPDQYRIKAIYGENGSGKSAIVTSMKLFKDLVLNDNYLNESKNQLFLEEIVNKKTKEFKFNCEFLVRFDSRHQDIPDILILNYSICLGKNDKDLFEIKYEKLLEKSGNYPNQNYKTLFECNKGELISIELEKNDVEFVSKKTLNLLSTHSLIYLYISKIRFEYKESNSDKKKLDLSLNIVLCIAFALTINIYLEEEDQHELFFIKKNLKEIRLDKQQIGEHLSELDDRLNAFSSVNEKKIEIKFFKEYEKKIGQLARFIKIFKPNLVSIDIEKKENDKYYICDLILDYGDYRINKEFESTGIKKLIRLFDCFLSASSSGIVFIDEMDSNLNDIYLCKLIEYFMYYGKGQLCFTAHNLDPMLVLKDNKYSIDFLSSDNNLVHWTTLGNSSPDSCYRNGMIKDSPFNIDATDFIGILGE